MPGTNNEYLRDINIGTGKYKVYYDSNTGNQTYTTTEIDEDAYWIQVQNTGASSLSFEINEDGDALTVLAGKESIGFPYKDPITNVEILATDTFSILIRK